MKLWRRNNLERIYADAAASTPISARSLRELIRLLKLYGNPGALHKEAVVAKQELENARQIIAKMIGAHSDEIIFTSGGTESNNLAIFGTLRILLNTHGELHAITSSIEHSSVLEPLRVLEREGLYITELPVDSEGVVSHKDLREAITNETVFVSIQMINSEVGTIQNIRELMKEVRHVRKERKNNIPLYFHTDASQAPLWLPIGVEQLGVDFLTLDGQKILGPKGVGVLFARRGVELEPLIYGGGQERGLRSGTENVALAGAFAVVLEDAQKDIDSRVEKVSVLRDALIQEIQKLIPGAEHNGAAGDMRGANNINMYIPNLNGDMAVIGLDAEGVAASTRSACDTDDEAPSHVLAALGIAPERAKNSIRITLLPSATKAEVRRIARVLKEVASRYSQK